MGLLQRRAEKKMHKAIARHHQTIAENNTLLVEYTVVVPTSGQVSVGEHWPSAPLQHERMWLEVFAATAFVTKQAFNLGSADGARMISEALPALADRSPQMVSGLEQPLEYKAQIWQGLHGGGDPFLQTPAKDDDNELLATAHLATFALLHHISDSRQASDKQIQAALMCLAGLRAEGYDPGIPEHMSLTPFKVMNELAAEGTVPEAFA